MAQRFRPVIEVEGLAPIKHCLRLSISQGIFDHHRFEIVVPHQALEGPAAEGFFQQAHHQLCGKRVTISLAPVAARGARPAFRFKGLITQLRLGSADDLAPVYVIEGYSPTYLLEGSAQRRTFVKQSLAQIGTAVLADYARNRLATQVTPSYRPLLPYTVQYDETDFAFLKRLAASRGEWLYYTGTDLVLGPPAPTPAVPFLVGGAQSFALTVSLRPTQFTAAEYDYRQHQTLRASSTAQPAPAHGTLASFAAQASEQLFAQPFRFAPGLRTHGPQQLDEAVRRLKSTLTGALVVFEGVGEQPDVAVGGLVAVEQPASGQRPAADLGRYRVLSVEHWLDDAGNYTNRFRAVPTGSAAPPVPVAAPVAGAMELAEVIDLNDPKRLGRVRVRYHWDVAQPAQAETGWLRVSTPYSGDGKGQLFTPERGSQVLVGYEHGLAEFPVVLGNVFHPHNAQGAAYSTPSNHLKGLQTAGGNKIVMNDIQGAQTILLSNSNKKGTSILVSFEGDGSVSITTNGPINLTSGDSISIAAKKNITLRAGEDIVLAADKNILAETKDESISLRAQKELLLTAVSDDLTLEAGAKKVVAKAADNIEIAASGVAKISGSDVKWSKP